MVIKRSSLARKSARMARNPFEMAPKELKGKKQVEDIQTKSLTARRARQAEASAARQIISDRRRRTNDLLGDF